VLALQSREPLGKRLGAIALDGRIRPNACPKSSENRGVSASFERDFADAAPSTPLAQRRRTT
jgi:hypothetical protein